MSRLVHFEVHAADLKRAADFYAAVFDWDVKPYPGMDDYYSIITGPKSQPGIDGGMMKRKGPEPEDGQPVNGFVCTMVVDDIDQYLEKVEGNGGRITVGKYALPGFAWLAYCKDTEGNIFGLYQEDPKAG